jgi:UDP-glucose 4-epimerase
MRRVLVTGAAGFIGSHLVERLLAAGDEVTGVDCFTPYYAEARKRANVEAALAQPRYRLLEVDLAAADLSALPRADLVYHLAAQAGVRASFGADFADYLRHNLLATQRLLERCVAAPPSRFVFASSSSVYGESPRPLAAETDPLAPLSPYGVTKVAGEQLVSVYGRRRAFEAVTLRLFTVYGPRQRPDMAFHRWIEALLDGRPLPLYGDGTQVRDFTYVADAVEGFVLAGEHGVAGGTYNIGRGRPRAVREVLATLEHFAGTRAERAESAAAAGDPRHTGADPSRARAELGFAATTGDDEGLAAQWAWQRGLRARSER